MEMKSIILNNGSEEATVLVASVTLSLETLLAKNPLAFYDLVELCRDSSYAVFPSNIDILKSSALMQSAGTIHGSIKNIVLSSVICDGIEMTLGSPNSRSN